MALVTLVSGGFDSTVMSLMAHDEGLEIHPLFIDYGQRSAEREWAACQLQHLSHQLPPPHKMDVAGFGRSVPSGLTNSTMRVNEDAFLPCRNLFFIVLGAAYACRVNAEAVAIGLLNPEFHLFPDQTREFIDKAEACVRSAVAIELRILVPLASFSKTDVLQEARRRGVEGTYSCHAGGLTPCGRCIACIEIDNTQ